MKCQVMRVGTHGGCDEWTDGSVKRVKSVKSVARWYTWYFGRKVQVDTTIVKREREKKIVVVYSLSCCVLYGVLPKSRCPCPVTNERGRSGMGERGRGRDLGGKVRMWVEG